MESTGNKAVIYEFGKFVLDRQERILLADGKPVHLTDKVFDTLLLLIQHNGRLLTKDEMMSELWEESFVEESNLAKNISRLRKILNTNGNQFIETLPKHGYRFLADVKEIDSETSLLVHRNLRVKITHTFENEVPSSEFQVQNQLANQSQIKHRKSQIFWLAALTVLVISGLGFYFWKREKPLVKNETGAIRLTDDPKHDTIPRWTNDGRIRFWRYGKDKQVESVLMNADGTNQTIVKDFNNLEYGIWSPDETKVLFFKRNDNTVLYLANSDGKREFALPFLPGNLDWSSDSQKIVYQKKVSETDSDIFVYSLETGKSKNITNHPAFDADPSYSPDGKQIVYQTELPDKTGELRVFDVESKESRVLQKTSNAEILPFFSPDGRKIVFQNKNDSNTEIYLINTDGSSLQNLTNNAARDGGAAFSPDGRNIVFSTNRDGNTGKSNLYLMDVDGGNQRQIYSAKNGMSGSATWSPDGSSIFFANDFANDGNFEIFKIPAEKSETAERLTFRQRVDVQPSVSPDGKQIAFASNTDGNWEVYLMNADGTGLLRLTRNLAADNTPQFSKDGNRIIFSSNRNGKFALYEIKIAE